MSIKDFWRKIRGKEPPLQAQARPLTFDPTQEQLVNRNEARVARLELALKVETDPAVRARLQGEIDRRRSTGR